MRRNEPNANERIVGPVPFYNNAGQLETGLTFTGAGETQVWNLDTGTWTDTTADAVEISGSGLYYVQLSQAESNHPSFVIVRLVKATYATQYYTMPIDERSLEIESTLTRLLGLHRENSVMDGGSGAPAAIYDGQVLVQARIRVFASSALSLAATLGAANNADGEIARYLLTAVAASGKVSTFTLVRSL